MAKDSYSTGKRVLVTGASSGIGRCVALDYAREGADLILAARSLDKLQSLQGEIEKLGRRVAIIQVDLSVRGEAEKMIDRALAECGSVDILVNNAGIGYVSAVAKLEVEKAREVFEINFWSVVEATRRLLPHLIARDSGQIINVSSIAGKRAFPLSSIYNASKFALEAFSESLRGELYRTNIQVISICPSVTETAFFDHPYVQGASLRRPSYVKNPMSAESVSKALIRASKKGRRDVHLTLSGWLVTRINPWIPGVVDRMVEKIRGQEAADILEAIRAGKK